MRRILIGAAVVALFFGGTLWALDALWPRNPMSDKRPALTELPPLPPVTRTSQIIAPVAVALNAVRDTRDAAAPRNLAGKGDNPLSELLGKADIGWTMGRGPMSVGGRPPDGISIVAPLNGTLRVTGQVANQAGGVTGAIAGIVGSDLGRGIQNLTTRALDQRADIRGNVTVTARPALATGWRVEPHLASQVAIADASLPVFGVKLSVPNEVKPLLDRTVDEQVAALEARLRADPFLEVAARREWTKMCRSISLGQAAAGMPNLWLELRPTRAFAAQPRVSDTALTLTIGVEAQTRIVPNETKPDCPFPAQLELVPQAEQGRVNIAVPIDIPFTEVNRLLEAQLKGKTFPDAKGSAFTATVRSVKLAASGDRLLITLGIQANETRSWFGLGADAVIHVWGRPVLDRTRQMVRLDDVALDVESQAAFGLLGAAARAAVPYLEQSVAENAVVDLVPLAANARTSIEAAISDFRKSADGVRVDAAVTDLRLVGIEFDAKTLRVIAEADGTVGVAVTKLP